MKILLEISYRGTDFAGFQVQSGARTVQGTLQDALEKLYGERPPVKGCSRTDSGVHARQFFATFDAESRVPCERLPFALNALLPEDISAKSARVVPESFHVRHDVSFKEYEYLILNETQRDPFFEGLAYRPKHPLDRTALSRAREAAAFIVGKQDFASFMSAGSNIVDTVRDVKSLEILEDGGLLRVRISADGFLYNMVRIITGTLIDVAFGRIEAGRIPEIIAARNRGAAGFTAPAEGLYLRRVEFLPGTLVSDLA